MNDNPNLQPIDLWTLLLVLAAIATILILFHFTGMPS